MVGLGDNLAERRPFSRLPDSAQNDDRRAVAAGGGFEVVDAAARGRTIAVGVKDDQVGLVKVVPAATAWSGRRASIVVAPWRASSVRRTSRESADSSTINTRGANFNRSSPSLKNRAAAERGAPRRLGGEENSGWCDACQSVVAGR